MVPRIRSLAKRALPAIPLVVAAVPSFFLAWLWLWGAFHPTGCLTYHSTGQLADRLTSALLLVVLVGAWLAAGATWLRRPGRPRLVAGFGLLALVPILVFAKAASNSWIVASWGAGSSACW